MASAGTRFAIGPDVALRLIETGAEPPHALVGPTLLRSDVLARLFAAVRHGEIDRTTAARRLDTFRALRIRLLGDRVLQRVAWEIAEELGWPDTYTAEYIAVTKLQADAFVTLDASLARAVRGIVETAPFEALLAG